MRRQTRRISKVAAVLGLLAGAAAHARADLVFKATGTFPDAVMFSGTLTIDTTTGAVTAADLMVGSTSLDIVQAQQSNSPGIGTFELLVGDTGTPSEAPFVDLILPTPNLV